jgi:hypothetical protein
MKDRLHLMNQLTDIIYYQIKTEGGKNEGERILARDIAGDTLKAIEKLHGVYKALDQESQAAYIEARKNNQM